MSGKGDVLDKVEVRQQGEELDRLRVACVIAVNVKIACYSEVRVGGSQGEK